jgi:hypothetical protein
MYWGDVVYSDIRTKLHEQASINSNYKEGELTDTCKHGIIDIASLKK